MSIYEQNYSASVDSHMSTSSAGFSTGPFADLPGSHEPYPAWGAEKNVPISTEEIEDIFLDLAQKFGFQKDSMRNQVCFFVLPFHLVLLTVPDHASSISL